MELQREVWVEYMDLGVISIYMVMDTMALGEVDWGGTESKTRSGQEQKLSQKQAKE